MSAESGGIPRLGVFVATSGHSGVDRIMSNLLPAIAGEGVAVDLLKVENHGPWLRGDHPGLQQIMLGSSHVNTSLPGVIRYLRKYRPDVILADKDKCNRLVILARWLARVQTRVVVRMGTTVSVNLRSRPIWQRWSQYLSIRLLYRYADNIIVPSRGVAEDLASIAGLPVERITVVQSPVVTDDFRRMLKEDVSHPWLNRKKVPVILGVGELSTRKDFATLIRAFARLRKEREVKLIILGKGRERKALQALCQELDVEYEVDLVGFNRNPYAFMARSDVFALTSTCEGLGLVLVEAMAVGLGLVATDCPSGPREILEDGGLGYLAPVGDVEAVTEGLRQMLDKPPDRTMLQESAQRFSIDASTRSYMRALGLGEGGGV